MPLYLQGTMVKSLSREIEKRQLEFMPFHDETVIKCSDVFDWYMMQTGHVLGAGVLQNIAICLSVINRAVKLLRGRLYKIGMVVVIMSHKYSVNLFNHAHFD